MPKSASLTSDRGKVRRAQPVYDDMDEVIEKTRAMQIKPAGFEDDEQRPAVSSKTSTTTTASSVSNANAMKQQGLFAAPAKQNEPTEAEQERIKRVIWESMTWNNLENTDPMLKSLIKSACDLNPGETPYSVWQRVTAEMNAKKDERPGFKHN